VSCLQPFLTVFIFAVVLAILVNLPVRRLQRRLGLSLLPRGDHRRGACGGQRHPSGASAGSQIRNLIEALPT